MPANIEILNMSSDIGQRLLDANMDYRVLQPYIAEDGKAYITRIENGEAKAVRVNNASLPKDAWEMLDQVIIEAAKPRMRLVNDLVAANLVKRLPNGFGVTVYQSQKASDISPAQVSMDAVNDSNSDRKDIDLENLPLPVIYKDCTFSLRELSAAKNGGYQMDTSTVEAAARVVAETAEKMLTGTFGTYKFGGGAIYGYTNFPARITTGITDWAAVGKTGTDRLNDVMMMKDLSKAAFHYGPWAVYVSSNYGRFLDEDYKDASDMTLAERILQVNGINSVAEADYLPDNTVILVQMTSDTVREIEGMPLTVLDWDMKGGLVKRFKVMTILTPQLRADYNDNCGIVHATGS